MGFVVVRIQVEAVKEGEIFTVVGYISSDSDDNDCLPDLDYRSMVKTKQTPRNVRPRPPPPPKGDSSSSVEEISSSDTEPFTRERDDPSWSPGKRTPVKEWGASGTPVKKQVKRRRRRRRAPAARALAVPPAPGPNVPPAPAPAPQMPWPAPRPDFGWPIPGPRPAPPGPNVPAPRPAPPGPNVPTPRPAPPPEPTPNPPVDPEIVRRPDPRAPPSTGTTPERPHTPTRRPDPKAPPSTGSTPTRPGTPPGIHPWALVLHSNHVQIDSSGDGPWRIREEDVEPSGVVVVRQIVDRVVRVGSTPPGTRKPDPNEPASVGGTPERPMPGTPTGQPPASPVESFSSADPGLPPDFDTEESEKDPARDPTDPDPDDPDAPVIPDRSDETVDAWFAQFSESEGSDYNPDSTPVDTSESSSSEDEPPPPKKARVAPTPTPAPTPAKVLHRDPQKVARRRQQEIHRPPLITPTQPKAKPDGGKKKDATTSAKSNTVAANTYWHRWKEERKLGKVQSLHTSVRGYFRPSAEERAKMSDFDYYRKEVKHYQTNQEPVIPVRPFIRAIRWITTDVVNRMYDPVVGTFPPEEKQMFRFQPEAYHALLEAAEAYLSGHLMGAWWCTIHAGRRTLMEKDLWLECKMRGIEKYGDKWDEWASHGTLLDSGNINLTDTVIYRDYPRLQEPVREKPGRAFFNATRHNILRFPKRARKATPKKKSSK